MFTLAASVDWDYVPNPLPASPAPSLSSMSEESLEQPLSCEDLVRMLDVKQLIEPMMETPLTGNVALALTEALEDAQSLLMRELGSSMNTPPLSPDALHEEPPLPEEEEEEENILDDNDADAAAAVAALPAYLDDGNLMELLSFAESDSNEYDHPWLDLDEHMKDDDKLYHDCMWSGSCAQQECTRPKSGMPKAAVVRPAGVPPQRAAAAAAGVPQRTTAEQTRQRLNSLCIESPPLFDEITADEEMPEEAISYVVDTYPGHDHSYHASYHLMPPETMLDRRRTEQQKRELSDSDQSDEEIDVVSLPTKIIKPQENIVVSKRQYKKRQTKNTANQKQNTTNQRHNAANQRQNTSHQRQNTSNQRQNTSNQRQNTSHQRQNTSNQRQNCTNQRQNTKQTKSRQTKQLSKQQQPKVLGRNANTSNTRKSLKVLADPQSLKLTFKRVAACDENAYQATPTETSSKRYNTRKSSSKTKLVKPPLVKPPPAKRRKRNNSGNSEVCVTDYDDDMYYEDEEGEEEEEEEEEAEEEEPPVNGAILTDAEKRKEHNKMERKRREDLKTSFERLCDAVPAARALERPAKVQILIQAANLIRNMEADDLQYQQMEKNLMEYQLKLRLELSFAKAEAKRNKRLRMFSSQDDSLQDQLLMDSSQDDLLIASLQDQLPLGTSL